MYWALLGIGLCLVIGYGYGKVYDRKMQKAGDEILKKIEAEDNLARNRAKFK